jgi:hypothetical protein
LQQILGIDVAHGALRFSQRTMNREAPLKPFSRPDERQVKQTSGNLLMLVQRTMGIVMVTVLAIAVLVEIAVVVAEIATRARLVANALTGRRVA